MYRTTRLGAGAVLLGLLTTAGSLSPAADPKIDLRTVKYDDLAKEIRALKGKVVVVDIWGEF